MKHMLLPMSLGTVNLISQFDFPVLGSSEKQPKSMALMWTSDRVQFACCHGKQILTLWMHPVLLVHTQIYATG